MDIKNINNLKIGCQKFHSCHTLNRYIRPPALSIMVFFVIQTFTLQTPMSDLFIKRLTYVHIQRNYKYHSLIILKFTK